MRCAIISDVHGNLEALEAVLAAIEDEDVDDILCLGDIVGYGASPGGCVRMLRAVGARCVAGNHDRAALGLEDMATFSRTARRAMAFTRDVLGEESRRFLASLPLLRIFGDELLMFHAALHPAPNTRLYLRSPAPIQKSMLALRLGGYGVRIGLFGHTHRPIAYRERSGVFAAAPGELVRIDDGAFYLINPGSVGQPRDGDSRASFAIYDGGARTVTFRRVSYDATLSMAKAARVGLVDEAGVWARARAEVRRMVGAARRGRGAQPFDACGAAAPSAASGGPGSASGSVPGGTR